jgi:hypothetical protein
LAPMAPVTVSPGASPQEFDCDGTSAEGAAHICEAVNRAFSAGVLGFARNLGRCPRLNVEFYAVGVKQKM